MSNSQVSSNRLYVPQSSSAGGDTLEMVTESTPTEEAKVKTYPASVTELSALLVQAHKESLGDCAVEQNPNNDTSPRVTLKKAHTCGSLFAKCGCNNDACTLLQTFSHPTTEPPHKRSSNPSISVTYCAKNFPKRLSNPEINEKSDDASLSPSASHKSSGAVIGSVINGGLKHPDIPYPIEIPKESRTGDAKLQRRSVSFCNNQPIDRSALVDRKKEEENLKYHKYTALSYGSFDNTHPAHKFFKEFGIFGPMGNELSNVVRKNSNIPHTESENCHPAIRSSSKIMCLDTNRRKDSIQREDYEQLKVKVVHLQKELSEGKRQIEHLRNDLGISESEVLKLRRENHKLKVCLSI